MNVRTQKAIQWLRDDEPIKGATAATYTLGSRDVTHTISAAVTHTQGGYRTVVEHVGAEVVKGTVRLNSTRARVRDGFVFVLRPTVAGQRLTEEARVWITSGGHRVVTGVLRNGYVRLRLTGLSRGHHTLWIHVDDTRVSLAKVVARRPYFR